MTVSSLWLKHRRVAKAAAANYRIPGYDRQDVEQEADIALWQAATRWRPDGGASFPTFARTVIVRHLTDCLRVATARKRWAPPDDTNIETLPHLHQVSDRVEDADDLRRLVEAINGLPAEQRRCVIGIAAGKSYAELGDPKAVDMSLWRARRKLREAA